MGSHKRARHQRSAFEAAETATEEHHTTRNSLETTNPIHLTSFIIPPRGYAISSTPCFLFMDD